MPDTHAQRQARYKARLAGRLPPFELITCSVCGGNSTGVHGPICRHCWLRTPEGREDVAARVRRSRANVTDRNSTQLMG